MPKLIIDDITVEVPAGTNVLEAAKQVGIVIPHFCYHEALGSVGACRLCAMKFVEGPVKGIQMSCMVPAQDGMVVSTADHEAVRMRQLVIEWLMVNHPHDCPVCDEGGECLLQDYTVAGGHGIRRYKGNKRTFLNQYLGPHIEHEMNRCIECYRCVRFYQEYAGGTDLGTMGSAGRVYFGRFADGLLKSPFSGNLLDICPTGVYTDKTARYRARYWDYEMAPSVCPWCSLGCATLPAARYRELLKIMPRRNDRVNGLFMCDRGRFAHYPVNIPVRPREPAVDGAAVGWDEALEALVARLKEVLQLHGAGSIAVVGSGRLPMEAAILLPRLAETIGAGFLCYTASGPEAAVTAAAVTALHQGNSASMADVSGADMVIVVRTNLTKEGPMLALSVRQAWRKGAKVYCTDPGSADSLEQNLAITVTRSASIEDIPLEEAQRPVIVCGTAHGRGELVRQVAKTPARLVFVFAGPNSMGAALLAGEHGAVSLADAVATGKVKGIVAFEADVAGALLDQVPFLAAVDWLSTEAMARAAVSLPTAAWVETDGTFINNEGRAQRFRQVMKPGLPIREFNRSVHPSHLPRHEPPGNQVRPAWQVVADIVRRFGGETVDHPLKGRWALLDSPEAFGEGVNCLRKKAET